jgi:hypothetical protein
MRAGAPLPTLVSGAVLSCDVACDVADFGAAMAGLTPGAVDGLAVRLAGVSNGLELLESTGCVAWCLGSEPVVGVGVGVGLGLAPSPHHFVAVIREV